MDNYSISFVLYIKFKARVNLHYFIYEPLDTILFKTNFYKCRIMKFYYEIVMRFIC